MLGLSQAQLGHALGVTFQQIQKYENGTSQLTPERLQRAAEILSVAVDFFFDGYEADGAKAVAGAKEGDTPGIDLLADVAMTDSQLLALVRSFTRIDDQAKRRGFLHLVRSIAKSDLAGAVPRAY
ncbi:MAG: helix-turn-helix transcriptional regulator [Rhodospirillales bacterium]